MTYTSTIKDGRTEYAVRLMWNRDAYQFISVTDFSDFGYQAGWQLNREFDRFRVEDWLKEHHLAPSSDNITEAAMIMGREWAEPQIQAMHRRLLYGDYHMLAPDPLIDAAIIKEREAKEAKEQVAQDALETNPLWGSF